MSTLPLWTLRPPPPPPLPPEPEVDPVVETKVLHVGYTGDVPQIIELLHCVRQLSIDAFYGDFELLDDRERILGVSSAGILSLLEPDLSTDVARVWHDALSRHSASFQKLRTKGHPHPGLDLAGLQPVSMRFLRAPRNVPRYNHIPVLVRVSALWDPARSCLVNI